MARLPPFMIPVAFVLVLIALAAINIQRQDRMILEINNPTTTTALTWELCEQRGIDCR